MRKISAFFSKVPLKLILPMLVVVLAGVFSIYKLNDRYEKVYILNRDIYQNEIITVDMLTIDSMHYKEYRKAVQQDRLITNIDDIVGRKVSVSKITKGSRITETLLYSKDFEGDGQVLINLRVHKDKPIPFQDSLAKGQKIDVSAYLDVQDPDTKERTSVIFPVLENAEIMGIEGSNGNIRGLTFKVDIKMRPYLEFLDQEAILSYSKPSESDLTRSCGGTLSNIINYEASALFSRESFYRLIIDYQKNDYDRYCKTAGAVVVPKKQVVENDEVSYNRYKDGEDLTKLRYDEYGNPIPYDFYRGVSTIKFERVKAIKGLVIAYENKELGLTKTYVFNYNLDFIDSDGEIDFSNILFKEIYDEVNKTLKDGSYEITVLNYLNDLNREKEVLSFIVDTKPAVLLDVRDNNEPVELTDLVFTIKKGQRLSDLFEYEVDDLSLGRQSLDIKRAIFDNSDDDDKTNYFATLSLVDGKEMKEFFTLDSDGEVVLKSELSTSTITLKLVIEDGTSFKTFKTLVLNITD